MSALQESSSIHQQAADTMSSKPEPLTITVKNLTAKVFLSVPEQDLIPIRYLRKAKQTPTVQRKAWIFRSGNEDGRDVDVSQWSQVDIRYRGVFKTLKKCPKFSEGLWDGGSESCQRALERGKLRAQGQVVYALLNEIGDMLNLERETYDGNGVFLLTPRLIETQIEYWTGYREKHRDGPDTAGFLSLEFKPDYAPSQLILPVSTTVKEQSLESALEGKFKLLLGQLLHHLRPLSVPGDKIPDQEIFLIGLHGSKLHLMRAFFPGQKISSLWCQRELPISEPLPTMRMHSPPRLFQNTAHNAHVDDWETDDGTDEHIENIQEEETRNNSNLLYTPEEMERLRQHLEATRLSRLDNEPDLRTFRVLATREYDLWLQKDFAEVVQILAALHLYLLSGDAQCGALQETFVRHPYFGEGDEYDSPTEMGEDLQARIRRDLRREQREIEEQEEQLRREEIIRREEDAQASRVRETMRNSRSDSIFSLRDARRRWWDFVWSDSEESLVQGNGNGDGEEDDDDMIVGNLGE